MSQAGWSAMLADRLPEDMTELLSDGRSVPVLREALRFPLGRANHTSSALIVTMMETIRRTMPTRQAELLSSALSVRASLEALLGENGVILHPAYSRPAPRHRGTLITPFDIQLSSHFSVMGMPSAIVPVGFTIRGLPLAVQLTAARQQDALALDAAAHLEAEFGGWVRAQPT
jgi:fatty acid amide hydrolase 2